MHVLLHILWNNVIPLSVMIGFGIILQRVFGLDIKTLTKLNFYLFSPGLAFLMLYESEISLSILLHVLLFFCVYFLLLIVVVELAVRIRRYNSSMKSAMRNSVLFYNSANYALPLNQLVFVNDPFTLSVQIIIMLLMSVIPNTYGIYSVNSHRQRWQKTMGIILSMPVIYAIPVAVLLRAFHLPLPGPIYVPLNYVADAFIATALITLGVQLGSMKWRFNFSEVAISNVLRLCVAPALGYLALKITGVEGTMAQALFLSCAVPTALSSVLLAVEFDNEPEFASQAVFSSTVFSIFTVTACIFFMRFI